jgi:hypothetical protein
MDGSSSPKEIFVQDFQKRLHAAITLYCPVPFFLSRKKDFPGRGVYSPVHRYGQQCAGFGANLSSAQGIEAEILSAG